VLGGTRHPDVRDVAVTSRPALGATATDVLAADGYLLGTPANVGELGATIAATLLD